MATTSGRFTFPVSTYYAKSRSFKQRIENFAEEIDSTLFQVIKTNMSSMHPQDQTVINKACKPGQKELTKLKTKYIPKWHSMQNENGNNPMIGVVEFDQKYQKSFDGLKSGKRQKEIDRKMAAFDRNVVTSVFIDQSEDLIREVMGNDWYDRLRHAHALSDFPEKFTKKFGEYAKKHPEKAAFYLEEMEKSGLLKKMMEGNNNLIEKLKKNPYVQKASKLNKWWSHFDNFMNGKWLKIGHKVLGSGVKFGQLGLVISIGINGYYNVKDERVLNNFKEGKVVRGSAKVVAGTALDMVKNFDVIDGIILGASIGGPWGALIGGVIGGGNQLAQFIWPKGYDYIKSSTFKGIDWAADMGTKAWNKAKSTASQAISKARSLQTRYNQIKSAASSAIQREAKSIGHSVGNSVKSKLDKLKKGFKVAEKSKGLLDAAKNFFNPGRKPAHSL